ncbi:unnamed protein product [Parajaminaea phylloscopi]
MLILLLILAFLSTALSRSQVPLCVRSQDCCAPLTRSLGRNKVAYNASDDSRYEQSRRYYNSRFNRVVPACVAYPEHAQDVSLLLRDVRATGCRFAIKAGGHSMEAGFSSVSDGILIDLQAMTHKSCDKSSKLCSLGPGNHFGTLYEYFDRTYGFTITGPRLSSIGVGALLGGGLSFLSGEYGLGIDGVRELEVVLPSGKIVTTSGQSDPELFYALRSGAGNAFGIVTNFTVAARPAGFFHSGNIIYPNSAWDAVLEAILEFTTANSHPKASIAGVPLYTPMQTPLNTSEFVVVALVYHGEDPGDAFEMFTKIPHISDSRKIRNYTETIARSLEFLPSDSVAAADYHFRASAHHATREALTRITTIWKRWAKENAEYLLVTTSTIQPITKSLTEASHGQNDNAIDLPPGPFFWIAWVLCISPDITERQRTELLRSFAAMIESTRGAPDLPLFPNDSGRDQNPLATFRGYPTLRRLKAKYDPDGFFYDHSIGWRFP